MWYDKLPRLRGQLSQVTFPYKMVTIVLRLKEIRYCSNVGRGSLKTLVYHGLPESLMKKYKNLETKCVTTSPGRPYFFNLSNRYSTSDAEIYPKDRKDN